MELIYERKSTVMKSVVPYIVFSLLAIVISSILAYVFGFSLTNTWQAAIALPFVLGPYWLWLWRVSSSLNVISPVISLSIRFILVVSAFMFLIIPFLSILRC